MKTNVFIPALLATLIGLSASAAAAEIVVRDAYMRSAAPDAPTGAAFMAIENTGDASVRLVAAESDIAARIELHTHLEDENGMMMMREIAGGIEIAPGATHRLQRGGDHVMMMGLSVPLVQGETRPLALRFDDGTVLDLDVVVDRETRAVPPAHGAPNASD